MWPDLHKQAINLFLIKIWDTKTSKRLPNVSRYYYTYESSRLHRASTIIVLTTFLPFVCPKWTIALVRFWHITSRRPLYVWNPATSLPTDVSIQRRNPVTFWKNDVLVTSLASSSRPRLSWRTFWCKHSQAECHLVFLVNNIILMHINLVRYCAYAYRSTQQEVVG